MKKCSSCSKDKPADGFQKDSHSKDGFRSSCKECQKRMNSTTRKDKKQRLVSRFGGGCVLCGYSKCLAALEFHHKDPSQKKFRLSGNSVMRSKFEILVEEAKKCVLLCANCHREIHFNEAEKDGSRV